MNVHHSRRPPAPPWTRWSPALVFVVVSMLLHAVGGATLVLTRDLWWPDPPEQPTRERLVLVQPPKLEEAEPEPEEEEPEPEEEPDGQLVEIAPPEDQERPEESEYLAEFDSTVEEETKTLEFEVNPEVVAPVPSEEQIAELADPAPDVNAIDPSSGATVGNDRFDPDRDGNLAALPSEWKITNKDGFEAPVPASQMASQLAGAPQNDLLVEDRGERVALNTREYIYATYLNRIKRLVNFYWKQNLDNLPASVRLYRPRYTTTVSALLDGDGALDAIEVTAESGSEPLDYAVVRAFRLAGPFPNPPEGLIEADGKVHLDDMQFTVILGQADNLYQGIDPRAGVQFPGILKGPR